MKQARPPVFKPLTHPENTSLFNFEPPASNVRTSAPVPFLRLNENQNVNNQTELGQHQDVGTERLSSLHAKLHQEADKIRKWKVQIEIELKQKEKKIHEASTTNESLRKSILELQLQNENLSLKLQEEMGNREEIVQRISSTRQLCNILKDHAVKLEEKLNHCETERTELKYLEKDHLHQFEELSAEFKKLEITTTESCNRLVNQLQLERDDRSRLEEALETKLTEAEIQLKVLMDQCDEKDIEIRDVRTMLQRNDEKIHSLEQSNATFHQKSEQQLAEIKLKDSDLVTTSEQLHFFQEEKVQNEAKVKELIAEMENLKEAKSTLEQTMVSSNTEYDAKLTSLQQQIDGLNCSLLSQVEICRKYEQQLSEMSSLSENLKSSKDVLMLEKTELEGTVSALNKDISEYQRTVDEQMKDNACFKEDQRQLTGELHESKQHILELQKAIECEQSEKLQKEEENKGLLDRIATCDITIQEKHEENLKAIHQCQILEDQQQVFRTELLDLQQSLMAEKEKLTNTSILLDNTRGELSTKEQDFKSLENEAKKLNKDYEMLQKDLKKTEDERRKLKDSLTHMEEENEQLTQKTQELQDIINELRDEKTEQDKYLDKEMQSKTKQMSNLEGKHKDLKGEITTKNKQIRELEKEIKGLKSKLTSQVKSTECKSKEYAELQEQMDTLKLEFDDMKSKLMLSDDDLKMAKLREEQAVQQMEEMKVKLGHSLMEQKETEERCEFQLSQMMATMEKYKQENGKIVQQKEKELELLRSKSDEFTTLKQLNNDQCGEMKKEIEEMTVNLDKEISEKNEVLSQLSQQRKKTDSMQKKIVQKETKIAQLQDEMKAMKQSQQIKRTSSALTQTSPMSSPAAILNPPTTTPQVSKRDSSPNSQTWTPQSALKTPQRSILRNTNSVSKRRKVAFASHDDSGTHTASDSDSSTELMEVELENIDVRQMKNAKTTPVLLRPSPKVKPSPKATTPDRRIEATQKTPLVRVPRGPPVKLKEKKEVSKCAVHEEREKFRELFPDQHGVLIGRRGNTQKMKVEKDTTHVRHTPSKNTGKFFKGSPRESLYKKPKKGEKDEIAWFDLDSVFGFGPED
ncbi:synaptonemal complex protein 1-like [Haliotis cracherodii]|uniref:synaptonemal complex protein 1-like n=1 Tax=Haliotis cracherodii TaxID=6455 RepID=UPI0039E999E7